MAERSAVGPPKIATSGQDALLATKLHVPRPQPGFVPRPRLAGRLDEGLARQLILVCAPAGSGKTALLADWARRGRCPVAWLSLDSGDNDPARLWRYAVAALDRVRPGISERVGPLLGPPAPPSFEGLVTALVNELDAEPGKREVLLILDDYHLIDSQAVHASLRFLLEHLPPGLHLVLASRSDPPLPLARLRASGQLAELRADDLRFTTGEAAALLREALGADLPDAAVAVLAARTEGWAAGLQLAALSLRGQEDAAGFVAAFGGSHRYVLDYLAGEVLDRQAEEVRGFLLETSVLERLSGALCDAVTGRADSQAMLEAIEHAGLFLVPLDEVRGWWRYHQLFADLLRVRLRQQRPERIPVLHRNAAAWHSEHGSADAAVRHAIAAGDMNWAARLMEQYFDELFYLRGEGATLKRWFSALPAGMIKSRPRLLVAQAAQVDTGGRAEEVGGLLDAAEHAYADAADEPFEPSAGQAASLLVNVPATIAVFRAYLAELRGDAEGAASFAAQALAAIGEGERMLDFITQGHLAIAEWLGGRLTESEQAFTSSIAGWRTAGLPTLIAWGGHHLGQVQRAQGRLDAARGTYQEALEFNAPRGRPTTPAAGIAYVGLGEVSYQQGDLDAALGYLTEGIALCRQFTYAPPLATGLATLGWTGRAGGDPSGALDAMGEAERAMPGPAVGLLNPVPAQRAGCCWPGARSPRPPAGPRNTAWARIRPRLPAGAGVPGAGPGAARPGSPRPGTRAPGQNARGGGRPKPGGQHHRDPGAAGTGTGGRRPGGRRGGRPGRGAHPGLPAGLCPGVRRRGAADGRAAGRAVAAQKTGQAAARGVELGCLGPGAAGVRRQGRHAKAPGETPRRCRAWPSS